MIISRESRVQFIERYYGLRYEFVSTLQGWYAGTAEGCVEWLSRFEEVGVRHVVLRFGGSDQLTQFDRAADHVRPGLRAEVT